MSNWRPYFNPEHLYFVTTNAVKHAHIFQRDIIKRLLVDMLDCMRSRKRIKLYAFVIMPNHIHTVIKCREEDTLADVIRDYKKFTSDRIIRHYCVEKNHEVLEFMHNSAELDRQKHKVWEDGYNAKNIFSPDFLRQKVEYIHNNPIQPHWELSEQPEDYMWSSARFYLLNESAIIPLDNLGKLLV